jgi:hypothetical protein
VQILGSQKEPRGASEKGFHERSLEREHAVKKRSARSGMAIWARQPMARLEPGNKHKIQNSKFNEALNGQRSREPAGEDYRQPQLLGTAGGILLSTQRRK